MEDLTKPAITRLARKAGIKSMSDDCYDTVRELIQNQLDEVTATMLVANSEHQTKTVMVEDVYEALRLLDYNLAESSDVGVSTCLK